MFQFNSIKMNIPVFITYKYIYLILQLKYYCLDIIKYIHCTYIYFSLVFQHEGEYCKHYSSPCHNEKSFFVFQSNYTIPKSIGYNKSVL